MAPVRDALDLVLTHAEPCPALVVDRHWDLVRANAGLGLLLDGVDPALLVPPVNVLRVSLHPDGVAPRIANLAEWRGHLLDRLERQIALTADPALTATRPGQLALAWVLAQGDTLVPIPGTRRIRTLEENAAAADIVLTPHDLARIEAVFPKGAATGERYAAAARAALNR